jgi:hypothetical protein
MSAPLFRGPALAVTLGSSFDSVEVTRTPSSSTSGFRAGNTGGIDQSAQPHDCHDPALAGICDLLRARFAGVAPNELNGPELARLTGLFVDEASKILVASRTQDELVENLAKAVLSHLPEAGYRAKLAANAQQTQQDAASQAATAVQQHNAVIAAVQNRSGLDPNTKQTLVQQHQSAINSLQVAQTNPGTSTAVANVKSVSTRRQRSARWRLHNQRKQLLPMRSWRPVWPRSRPRITEPANNNGTFNVSRGRETAVRQRSPSDLPTG